MSLWSLRQSAHTQTSSRKALPFLTAYWYFIICFIMTVRQSQVLSLCNPAMQAPNRNNDIPRIKGKKYTTIDIFINTISFRLDSRIKIIIDKEMLFIFRNYEQGHLENAENGNRLRGILMCAVLTTSLIFFVSIFPPFSNSNYQVDQKDLALIPCWSRPETRRPEQGSVSPCSGFFIMKVNTATSEGIVRYCLWLGQMEFWRCAGKWGEKKWTLCQSSRRRSRLRCISHHRAEGSVPRRFLTLMLFLGFLISQA